jgi:hypothetical protein
LGEHFLYGQGAQVDKYKALEWYIKSGNQPEQVKMLNKQGVHLKEEDKTRLYY